MSLKRRRCVEVQVFHADFRWNLSLLDSNSICIPVYIIWLCCFFLEWDSGRILCWWDLSFQDFGVNDWAVRVNWVPMTKRKSNQHKSCVRWKRKILLMVLLSFCFGSLILMQNQYTRIKVLASLVSPELVQKPKIAFLFIARNRLPLDVVWDVFFRVIPSNAWSLYHLMLYFLMLNWHIYIYFNGKWHLLPPPVMIATPVNTL